MTLLKRVGIAASALIIIGCATIELRITLSLVSPVLSLRPMLWSAVH